MNQDLLHNYFKGETSVDEEKRILNWVDESEENRKTLQKERMLFDIALFTDSKRKMREKAGAGARIIPMLRWSARIAAAVIVAVSCGFLINEYRYDKLAQLQTVTVPAGQRAQITLADGTKVWLNSESTLSYRSDFGRRDRDVELDGEAYFEVTHNEDKPFVVQTNKCNVEVLGTKFNVEAYSDSEDFCTSLMEGSVRVSDKRNPSETLVLAPNQQVSLINGHLQSKSIADFDPFRWKEGLICFKDMNFKELMSRFEKCYGIHVIIENPKLTDYICSGKFRISDGIDKALHILQKDAKYTFERNKDESVIYIK